jgi:hypothetical protein
MIGKFTLSLSAAVVALVLDSDVRTVSSLKLTTRTKMFPAVGSQTQSESQSTWLYSLFTGKGESKEVVKEEEKRPSSPTLSISGVSSTTSGEGSSSSLEPDSDWQSAVVNSASETKQTSNTDDIYSDERITQFIENDLLESEIEKFWCSKLSSGEHLNSYRTHLQEFIQNEYKYNKSSSEDFRKVRDLYLARLQKSNDNISKVLKHQHEKNSKSLQNQNAHARKQWDELPKVAAETDKRSSGNSRKAALDLYQKELASFDARVQNDLNLDRFYRSSFDFDASMPSNAVETSFERVNRVHREEFRVRPVNEPRDLLQDQLYNRNNFLWRRRR